MKPKEFLMDVVSRMGAEDWDASMVRNPGYANHDYVNVEGMDVRHDASGKPWRPPVARLWFDRRSNGTHLFFSIDAVSHGEASSVVMQGWDERHAVPALLACAVVRNDPLARSLLKPSQKLADGRICRSAIEYLQLELSKSLLRLEWSDAKDVLEVSPKWVRDSVVLLRTRFGEFRQDDFNSAKARVSSALSGFSDLGASEEEVVQLWREVQMKKVLES